MSEDAGAASPGPRVAAAALLLAASVLLSRILGFVREAVLAYRVGVGGEADAFAAAFQLPDLLFHFLSGGALSIAFLPFYTRARTEGGDAEATRLLATVLGTLAVLSAAATAVLWWWAQPLVALQFPGFDAEKTSLTVRLTRIVLPAQVFFVVGGVIRAALMARGHFGAQAAGPLLYNAGVIAGGLLLAPTLGVAGFAWGALAGAAAGPLGAALVEARGRVRLGFRFAPHDPAFLRYLAAAAPLMVGVTLLTVDEWYGRWFGALAGEGTVATVVYARRLMLVPVALVGQAMATAALPALSQLVADARKAELAALVERTARVALGLALLAAAALAALAEPAVEAVYRRGAFEAGDVAPVAETLRLFALAVPGWVLQTVAVRPFYARRDFWRPMLLGTAVAGAAVPVYLALGPRFGAPGLAGAAAVAVSANALATLLYARGRHGAPALAPVLGSGARALAGALPAALAAHLAAAYAAESAIPGGAFLELAAGVAAFGAVAGLGVLAVGDAPLRDTLRRMARRLLRRGRGVR